MKLYEIVDIEAHKLKNLATQTFVDSEFGAFCINEPLARIKDILGAYSESLGLISPQSFEQSPKRQYFDNAYKFANFLRMNFKPDSKKWARTSFVDKAP